MRSNPKKSVKAIKREQAKAKAMAKISVPEKLTGATYDERIAPKKKQAMQAGVDDFIENVRGAEEDLNSSVEFGISAVNKMARAGKKWQAFSDKNQFDMGFYNEIDKLVKPQDQKYITPNIVTTAIHLANAIQKPVKTVAEAGEHIQKLMFAFEKLEKPRRQLASGSSNEDWGAQLSVETGKWVGWLEGMIKAEPVELWPSDRCEMFLAKTDLIAQQREAVKAKLAATVSGNKPSEAAVA